VPNFWFADDPRADLCGSICAWFSAWLYWRANQGVLYGLQADPARHRTSPSLPAAISSAVMRVCHCLYVLGEELHVAPPRQGPTSNGRPVASRLRQCADPGLADDPSACNSRFCWQVARIIH